MKKFFCLILTISLLLTFIACSSGETNINTNSIKTEEKSLTDDEKIIFDALKIAVFRFNSPSTVKIIKTSSFFEKNSILYGLHVYIYIEGVSQNGWYELLLEDFEQDKKGDIFYKDDGSTFSTNPDINNEKLTHVLQSYVNNPSTPRPTAYDLLNGKEKLIFDALTTGIYTFYNPSSVRVLQVGYFSIAGSQDVCLKIQATNRMGGTSHEWYEVSCASYTYDDNFYVAKGTISKMGYEPGVKQNRYVDASKINRALIEYWENQGLK